jgi:hypothetical protein
MEESTTPTCNTAKWSPFVAISGSSLESSLAIDMKRAYGHLGLATSQKTLKNMNTEKVHYNSPNETNEIGWRPAKAQISKVFGSSAPLK